jgi:hypothetical protein
VAVVVKGLHISSSRPEAINMHAQWLKCSIEIQGSGFVISKNQQYGIPIPQKPYFDLGYSKPSRIKEIN